MTATAATESTDRDFIIEAFKRADAMSEVEFQAELRKNEIAWFNSCTKYDDNENVIERLAYYADTEPLNYEHLRESQAQRLGVRAPVLDKLVEKRREPKSKQADKSIETKPLATSSSELQGSAVLCPDVLPWPEAVDGAAVLNEVAETVSRYVVLPEGAVNMLALWCAHTYCFKLFQYSPRLNITSPEKGCGKSTLRDVIALLVNRPLCLDNLTTAVTFRLLDKYAPTLLADEADAWLLENEELRGALNAGHSQSGLIARCEGEGNEVRAFKVFAPAALCGIGNLPGTLRDRSIMIRLKRAKLGEVKARFDSRRTDKEKEIARRLARFCVANRERLQTIEPQLPSGVFNRVADNWRPLFAIAGVAGSDWPERCAAAFAKLTSYENTDMETLKVMLLADIGQVISKQGLEAGDWIASGELINSLTEMTERPWGEANRGKPINERWLSVKLGAFDIKPGKLPREGDQQKRGYNIATFKDALERYLHPPVTSGQVSQQPFLRGGNAETDSETDVKIASVSAIHEGRTPSETDVHLKNGGQRAL
jgi:putative DNA primase/helicase